MPEEHIVEAPLDKIKNEDQQLLNNIKKYQTFERECAPATTAPVFALQATAATERRGRRRVGAHTHVGDGMGERRS